MNILTVVYRHSPEEISDIGRCLEIKIDSSQGSRNRRAVARPACLTSTQ